MAPNTSRKRSGNSSVLARDGDAPGDRNRLLGDLWCWRDLPGPSRHAFEFAVLQLRRCAIPGNCPRWIRPSGSGGRPGGVIINELVHTTEPGHDLVSLHLSEDAGPGQKHGCYSQYHQQSQPAEQCKLEIPFSRGEFGPGPLLPPFVLSLIHI